MQMQEVSLVKLDMKICMKYFAHYYEYITFVFMPDYFDMSHLCTRQMKIPLNFL